jgi:hypothetical protein
MYCNKVNPRGIKFFGSVFHHSYLYGQLKHLTIILLILGLFGQTFNRYFLVLNYQLNKDFIAKYLCENKNKPELKCEGKCYLCKRLKKEDNKDQENPERKTTIKFDVLSYQGSYCISGRVGGIIPLTYFMFQEDIYSSYIPSFLHPPQW